MTADRQCTDPDLLLADRSVELAGRLLDASHNEAGWLSRRREQRLRRILGTDSGTKLAFAIADRALRPVSPAAGAGEFSRIAAGDLSALSTLDRSLFKTGSSLEGLAPAALMGAVTARLNHETSALIWPLGRGLARRLRTLRDEGRRANVNLLGEAILGYGEASRRVAAIQQLISRPDVDAVSVKLSAVAPTPTLLDEEGSVSRAADPLRQLYRAAAAAPHRPLINLDMEEHHDLDLTVAAFRQVLDEPEFEQLTAGIALQAYLPDTHGALMSLLDWSDRRQQRTGGRIRIRLVKGANLAVERVIADLHGWPQAPYHSKEETDASYLRLADTLLAPEVARHTSVGIASHNLFDIATALNWAEDRGVSASVEVEMLAGMAEGQARAVAAIAGGLLEYVPVTPKGDYRKALAYLARRLDENTTPDGFLRHVLELEVGNDAWEEQRIRFARSVTARHTVRRARYQAQDRNGGSAPPHLPPAMEAPGRPSTFANEPDTDLSVPANRSWARAALAGRASADTDAGAGLSGRERRGGPPRTQVSVADADAAVARAAAASKAWATSAPSVRRRLLHAVGRQLALRRGEALGVMASETGKTFAEADPEISEAIDFAHWYAEGTRLFEELDSVAETVPLGVVTVAPPWNFPLSIPAGGVLATVAAGGAAILKPSPEARGCSTLIFAAVRAAASEADADADEIPTDLVQLIPADDDEAGRRLIEHPEVETVVLTGGWSTAQRFQRWRPDLRLLAETSGKNSMVITATADVDQAVADLVASAFGHAGQKCSAASLAIVDASVYDRSPFLRQLADAVRSLRIGPATDPATQMGPLVGPETDKLVRALTGLEPGESWLVKPRLLDERRRLWSPGVRLGVKPGTWTHLTEWFGPVLGVMRAESFEEAVSWQNSVPYGLTAGIQSTDPEEQDRWTASAEAGNLYVNRTITGAIVGRQPFGGWKRSAWGPTAKTGGPDYLVALSRWRDRAPGGRENDYERVAPALMAPAEMAGLRVESNRLCRRPLPGVIVRVATDVDSDQVDLARAAARATGTPVELTSPADEPVDDLAARLDPQCLLRILGSPETDLLAAAAGAGMSVLAEPLVSSGRVELPRWLREQSVSRSRHRYGNIVIPPTK